MLVAELCNKLFTIVLIELLIQGESWVSKYQVKNLPL